MISNAEKVKTQLNIILKPYPCSLYTYLYLYVLFTHLLPDKEQHLQ